MIDRSVVLGVAATLVLIGAGRPLAQLAESPWPMLGHDAQHTGRSPHKGVQTAHIRWRFDAGSAITSSPTIGPDETIYVGSSHQLVALESDGTENWRFQMGGRMGGFFESSAAIGSDGTIYAGCDDGWVYAVNPDGTQRWRFQTEDHIESAPAIGPDGTVYAASQDRHLYAIHPDGSLKWRLDTDGPMGSSPAVDQDGTVYVGCGAYSPGLFDWDLYAVNPDGSVKWKFTTQWGFSVAPVIGPDGTVYASSNDGCFYAISPDGTLKWHFLAEDGTWYSACAALGWDGTIYVPAYGGLHAVNPDGTTKWTFRGVAGDYSSPVVDADGTVYVCSEHPEYCVYALNPDGTEKWSYAGEDRFASPAIGSDGTIYIGSADGHLYAFGRDSGPSIVLGQTGVNFGAVETGASKALTLAVFNVGDSPLSVTSITPSSAEFDVSVGSFGVAVDSSSEVRVVFTPQSQGCVLGLLQIASNDARQPVVTASLAANFRLAGSPWPVRAHDVRHTGQSPYRATDQPELRWKLSVGDKVTCSPTIGPDGTVYVGRDRGSLFAINRDGTMRWRSGVASSVRTACAIGSDGTIYAGHWNGPFYALNSDGTLKWTCSRDRGMDYAPVMASDGTIYVGPGLRAIHPDGTVKWEYTACSDVRCSPAIGPDGTIYAASWDGYLRAVNPDGTLEWRLRTEGGGIEASPCVGPDSTIYLGSGSGVFYAVQPDGAPKWTIEMYEESGSFSSPAVALDGTIYVRAPDGYLYAISPEGVVQWKYELEGWPDVAPAIDSTGVIYVGSEDGHLFAVNPDGTLKWKYQTEGAVRSSPAIDADGTIYVGSADGNVYALGRGAQSVAQGRPDETAVPEEFGLRQSIPNPFNARTTIRYELPDLCQVRLSIHNALGQKLRTLVEETQPGGFYAARWDGKDQSGVDVGSGIYLYRLGAGGYCAVKKMLLLK